MIWEYLESECGDWRFLRIQTTDTVKNLNHKKKKKGTNRKGYLKGTVIVS